MFGETVAHYGDAVVERADYPEKSGYTFVRWQVRSADEANVADGTVKGDAGYDPVYKRTGGTGGNGDGNDAGIVAHLFSAFGSGKSKSSGGGSSGGGGGGSSKLEWMRTSFKYTKGGNLKISWKKVKDASKYKVYVQYCGKPFTKKAQVSVSGKKTKAPAIGKIGKKAIDKSVVVKYVVRAYDGGDLIGKSVVCHVAGRNCGYASNAVKVKSGSTNKKNTVSVLKKRKKSLQMTNTLDRKGIPEVSDGHCAQFRYVSLKPSVVSVSKDGIITGKKKGTGKVRIYARDGAYKTVKVKVKKAASSKGSGK